MQEISSVHRMDVEVGVIYTTKKIGAVTTHETNLLLSGTIDDNTKHVTKTRKRKKCRVETAECATQTSGIWIDNDARTKEFKKINKMYKRVKNMISKIQTENES
jgi:hypothetical protein